MQQGLILIIAFDGTIGIKFECNKLFFPLNVDLGVDNLNKWRTFFVVAAHLEHHLAGESSLLNFLLLFITTSGARGLMQLDA
jgi:hypothetical protein